MIIFYIPSDEKGKTDYLTSTFSFSFKKEIDRINMLWYLAGYDVSSKSIKGVDDMYERLAIQYSTICNYHPLFKLFLPKANLMRINKKEDVDIWKKCIWHAIVMNRLYKMKYNI